MISVLIFSLVMTVALGALLAMSQSDQRAETLKSVVNNLNFALDSMSRAIRTGYNYHCGTTGNVTTPIPQDCDGNGSPATPTSGTYLALRVARATDGTPGALTVYCWDPASQSIRREQLTGGSPDIACSSSNFSPLTSSEVHVTNMQFIVSGSCAQQSGSGCTDDDIQPKVTMLVSGWVPVSAAASTTFNLQTSVTQRVYDK